MRGGLGAVAQLRGPLTSLCGATLGGAKSSFECWKMQHATLGTGWVLEADNVGLLQYNVRFSYLHTLIDYLLFAKNTKN